MDSLFAISLYLGDPMLVRRVAIVLLLLMTVSVGTASASVKPKPIDTSDISGVQVAVVESEIRDLGAYLVTIDQEHLAAYLTAVEASKVVSQVQTTQVRSVPTNNGAHSDAWWQGVSVCEQSGVNSPYYGYFSIMDGSAAGLSWDQQVAMANQIIARSGDGAWAQSCQNAGYAASPSG